MPLRSRLFRGDPALEACLMKDSSHITPGAHGDHVAKIQTAVCILNGYTIATTELATERYGPSTAAAILAYKQKHRIINKSYQSQADNIVGKMTIAALDQGMVEVESRPAPMDGRGYFYSATHLGQ